MGLQILALNLKQRFGMREPLCYAEVPGTQKPFHKTVLAHPQPFLVLEQRRWAPGNAGTA